MDEARHSELKIIRWTDRIEEILAGQPLGPIKANLDLTNLCSHNCEWCEPLDFRKHTIADNRHTLLDTKAVEVLDDLADLCCKFVMFSGGGEPTLHPHFGGILSYAHVLGMRTMVITHGGVLHRWSAECLAYADHVRISLDASNSEEHQSVHGYRGLPFEFDRIRTGILMLTEAEKRPEVGIAYVVTPGKNDSPASLNRVVDLACSLGVDYLHFRPASGVATQGTWLVASEVIEEIEKTHPRVKIWCFGKRLNDIFTQREFSRCYAALTLATIGANGDVSACCDNRSVVFGNVHQERFRDIWLSERHREMAAKIVPKLCPRCLQCGTNRAIERYVVGNEALPELL